MSLKTIKVIAPNGDTVEVPASSRGAYERQGWKVAEDQNADAKPGTAVRNDPPGA